MPSLIVYLWILLLLFSVEILYFRIARGYNIIDKPNDRSSHTSVTLRGGGIIFPIAAVLFYVGYGFQNHYFQAGLIAISTISLLDDILKLSNKIRIAVHLFAVSLLLYQWDMPPFQWYWMIFLAIAIIGTINAYNFMDGINGITGAYSFLTIISLYYINESVVEFTSPEFIKIIMLALLVFNFFNFRNKARCFAGDVGSVSIAYIIIFLLGQLILKTHNVIYLSLLLIYGLDAVSTILFRLVRKENIFEAHRSHLYQYLANEKKILHLWVSGFYGLIQLTVNILIIFFYSHSTSFDESCRSQLAILCIAALLFIYLRFQIEGKQRLLNGLSSS